MPNESPVTSTMSYDKSGFVPTVPRPRVPSEISTLRPFDDDLFLVDKEFANSRLEGLMLPSLELSSFKKKAATTTGRLQTIKEKQSFL